MGDSKKVKELTKNLDISIQYYYRYKKVKELKPDLAERLRKGEKISLAKAYQEATGRQLKTKRTVCLNSIENQNLELAKEYLEELFNEPITYSDMIKRALNCYYKSFGLENKE